MVTLFLENQSKVEDNSMIFECFRDAGVVSVFEKLPTEEQNQILKSINGLATEEQQVEKILKIIKGLNDWNSKIMSTKRVK